MTRGDWVMLAMGAVLSASLLPACMRSGAEVAPPAGLAKDSHPPPVPEAASPDALNQAVPADTANKPTKREKGVEQATDPDSQDHTVPVVEVLGIQPQGSAGETAEAATPAPAPVPAPKPAEEPPLLVVLRCFLAKKPGEAIGILQKNFAKPNQDMLFQGVLPFVAWLAEESLDKASPRDVAFYLDQLQAKVMIPLRTRASLVIDQLSFCKWIRTFGVYEPLADEYRFHPGEQALVYVELRNFSSEKRETVPGQPVYVTSLESSAEIFDYNKQKVWPPGRERFTFRRDGPDISRTLRHDYFDACHFLVPDLPAGDYTLWIQVQDVVTKRSVRRSIDFKVTTAVPVRGL